MTPTAESTKEPSLLKQPLSPLVEAKWRLLLAPLLLLLVAVAAYGGCFAVGFSSDDFEYVEHFERMLKGDWALFFGNLTSCSLSNPGYGLHFRPLLQLPFILDTALWHANPTGWHCTNFILHWLCAIAVYHCGRRLIEFFGDGEGKSKTNPLSWSALVGAALFAANPLQTETVNWLVSRVDSLCCLFYVLALYCRLTCEGASSRWRWLALLLFVGALGSKESAVTLPAVLVLLHKIQGLTFRKALQTTAPFWFALLAYFVLRSFALGTFVGSYVSIADNTSSHVILRFLSPQFLKFVFLPVPSTTFDQLLPAVVLAVVGYAGLLSLLIFAAGKRALNSAAARACLFLLGWFVLGLAPIALLFSPYADMLGNRWLYLPSVPLCLLLALGAMRLPSVSLAPLWLRVLPLLLIFVSYIAMSQSNTAVWQSATELCASVCGALSSYVRTCRGQYPLLIGLPARLHGAHVHYLRQTVVLGMQAPFAALQLTEKEAERVRFLEPNWYIEPGIVNYAALLRAFASPEYRLCEARLRSDGEATIVPLSAKPAGAAQVLSFQGTDVAVVRQDNLCHFTFNFAKPINPLDYPLLLIEFAGAPPQTPAFLYVKTPSMNAYAADFSRTVQPVVVDGNKLLIYPGELKMWSTSASVDRLCVSIPVKDQSACRLLRATFSHDRNYVPQLEPGPDLKLAEAGTYAPTSSAGYLAYDVSRLPGATAAEVEVSGPLNRFLYASGTYRDQQRCTTATRQRMVLPAVQGRFALPKVEKMQLAHPYWYSVRIFGIDYQGDIIGLSSDPLYIRLEANKP
mgnify:CR=1 FL=1